MYEVYECRQRATCTKLSKILKTASREALLHCSMAVSMICLAMLLLVSLSSLASSIPCCLHAIALMQQHSKVLFQFQNV